MVAITFGFAVLLGTEAQAQIITDSFANASAWGTPLTESGKNISVGSGRLNFISANTYGGTAAIPRSTPLLATTQHWSVQVDAHLADFNITAGEQSVSLFLGIGKTANWLDTHVLLGFDRDDHFPDSFGMNDDFSVNGSSIPGFFNVNNMPSGDVAMRLEYNATAKTLAFLYDANGATGGYAWTQLGITNIASGTYNLQLGPTDTFTILLAGWSAEQVVTNGQAYFDNLEIAITSIGYAPDSIVGYTVAGTITNVSGSIIPPASATNSYDLTTFSQIGPNSDSTYSGNYAYIKTGTNTGTIFVYKTAPPDQAGETTTNYLVFSSPLMGTFAHLYDFVDTPPTVQYGTFQVVQTNAVFGSLQVAISPTNAVSAGAQWQVDGGDWQNHSNVVSGLTIGNHSVSYKTISGWNTPSNQIVVVSAGMTSVTNGIYTPQTGSLQVTIIPAAAVTAGAQWQADGGAWQNSGSILGSLLKGFHTVSYKPVTGWNAPSSQTVLVTAGATTITNGNYVQEPGLLEAGLVAHFPLNGNANDMTTNGNHGTVYGASPITNRFDVQNAAYYFNGTDNYIRIPQSSSLSSLSTATFSYWVKYYRTGIGNYQVSMTICNGQDRFSPPGFWTYATADRLMHFLGRQGGVSEHVDIPVAATTPLAQQPFVFVTFVVNSTNMLSYKNGILQQTAPRQGLPIARPNYDWFLGTSGDFAFFPYYLDGILDDVRIYNRALSDLEVWQLYSSEAVMTNAAPVIITTDAGFGVSNGVFGFNLSGTAGQTVVTEATTNLANPIWVPLQTNALDGETFYFSDPEWTNFAGRFYRIRLP